MVHHVTTGGVAAAGCCCSCSSAKHASALTQAREPIFFLGHSCFTHLASGHSCLRFDWCVLLRQLPARPKCGRAPESYIWQLLERLWMPPGATGGPRDQLHASRPGLSRLRELSKHIRRPSPTATLSAGSTAVSSIGRNGKSGAGEGSSGDANGGGGRGGSGSGSIDAGKVAHQEALAHAARLEASVNTH